MKATLTKYRSISKLNNRDEEQLEDEGTEDLPTLTEVQQSIRRMKNNPVPGDENHASKNHPLNIEK